MINRYNCAEKLLTANTKESVLNGDVKVTWLDDHYCWYFVEERVDGQVKKKLVVVSTNSGKKSTLFSCDDLIGKINKLIGTNYGTDDLSLKDLSYSPYVDSIQFEVKGFMFDYHLSTHELSLVNKKELLDDDESLSPNGQYVAYINDYNLYIRELNTGKVTQLTFDGIQNFDYASEPGANNRAVYNKVNRVKIKPGVLWSPDSTKILTYKLDQQHVKELHVIQSVIEDNDEQRPIIHSYPYHLPGDQDVPKAHLYMCDIQSALCEKINVNPLYINFTPPFTEEYKKARWSEDGKLVYVTQLSRDFKQVRFNVINAMTLDVEEVLLEQSDTFLFLDTFGQIDGNEDYGFNNRLLEGNHQFIWHSEKSGWSHLYMHDLETGEMIYPITTGEWAVKSLIDINMEEEWIYFIGGGREKNRDPYYNHLYRVQFDGSNLTLLTPEDADHSITLSPNHLFLVDTFSRADLPPKTVLRKVDGTYITQLEEANIDELIEKGYSIPKRIKMKASDGQTDLYGLLILPADLDVNKKYPMIDYIYGGVQTINTPKKFTWKTDFADPLGGLQSLVQLGFVGLIMDGTGTPQRSKRLHDYSYQNLQGSAGLIDHVHCSKALAEKYTFIDIDRVGLWGSSGGGYATVRAMLEYPEFYKVGVSSAGNHDPRLYNAAWVERYNGLLDKKIYEKQDNTKLVGNLKGRLLLAHGDLDDNVHISQSIRLIDALVKENKDFDFILLPNEYHDLTNHPYFIRRKWDYFVKYLLLEEPPKEYLIDVKK